MLGKVKSCTIMRLMTIDDRLIKTITLQDEVLKFLFLEVNHLANRVFPAMRKTVEKKGYLVEDETIYLCEDGSLMQVLNCSMEFLCADFITTLKQL